VEARNAGEDERPLPK